MARFSILFVAIFLVAPLCRAQNSYLPATDRTYHLLERMETKSGAFSNDLFLSNKGIYRKDAYDFLSGFRNEGYYSEKTTVDNYNIFESLSENGEWKLPSGDGAEVSEYALGPFYKRRPDFLYVHKPHFFWVINPVLGAQIISQQQPEQQWLWSTTEGLETRGNINDILGFSFSLTHNYFQPVNYQQQFIDQWQTIPGASSFSKSKNGYQYLLFEGNLNTSLIKDHISLDLGYGKHFIGDGIRSLFLSGNAPAAYYVGINTKIWRLNYQNLYLWLTPNDLLGQTPEKGNKYATIHYLSINIRPWLNIGFFETVTFARAGGYEIAYLNPIIFYRAIERSLGSPDKVAIGFNAKAIAMKRFNFYGQFLINEFSGKNFFSNDGYWANKWGAQVGVKYFDAFSLSNLDLQAEVNMVRPYTYSHRADPEGLATDNFSSGNQPMAHPLGSGFQELIGMATYQPLPKLTIEARAMLYRQGTDTGNANFGNNIFKSYTTRNSDYGIHFINGPEATCMMYRLDITYELKPQLFFFAGTSYRKYTMKQNIRPEQKDFYINAGFRLNLNRQQQNWY
jgi:hypothetical protein